MDQQSRALDPELAALATLVPTLDFTKPQSARDLERAISIEMGRTPVSGVERTDLEIARPDGSIMKAYLHRPQQLARSGPLPVLFFLHGGSFVTGGLHTEEARCEYYASAAGCAVISVDYSLAPEHRYPAALDDCLFGLHWLMSQPSEVRLDKSRVAIGGLSAGGALAAATALWWRDAAAGSAGRLPGGAELQETWSQSHRPVLLLLLHPVLDASVSTRSATSLDDTPILSAQHLPIMWQQYLGDDFGSDHISSWASPSFAQDVRGLPPVYMVTSQHDPLRDECLQFALKLIAADVPVELRHHSRAFHSFDSFSASRMGSIERAAQVAALTSAFR